MRPGKTTLLAAMVAAPLLMPTEALADRCKQYTKTIRIDGVLEVGVGKACERRDGDWEIISLKGPWEIQNRLRDDIYDDLYDRGFRVMVVNNYGYSRPYYHHPRVVYYSPRHHSHSHKSHAYRVGYNSGKHYKYDHDDDHGYKSKKSHKHKKNKSHKKHH